MSEFKVVGFPETAVNVCERLRNLANRIESGKYGTIRFAGIALIDSTNNIITFGFGNVSDLELTGAFSRASVLAGCCINDIETKEDETPGVA